MKPFSAKRLSARDPSARTAIAQALEALKVLSLQREKERVADSRLKIQSVANSLNHVNPSKVPNFEEIQECLEDADESLRGALRDSSSS